MDFYYNEQKPQRVLILAADTGEYDASASVDEMKELIKTAGGETVGVIIQQLTNTAPNVTAVAFELCFTGTARTDTCAQN